MALVVQPPEPTDGESTALVRPPQWHAVLAAYLDTRDSPKTRRSYGRHIRAALTFLEVDTLDEPTGALLTEYRALVTSSPLSPASRAQALAALRSFLRWARVVAGAHGLAKEVVDEALKTARTSVQRPTASSRTDAEVMKMAAAARTTRDRAIWPCSSAPGCA